MSIAPRWLVIGLLLATGCGGTQWSDTVAAPPPTTVRPRPPVSAVAAPTTSVRPRPPVIAAPAPSGWVSYRDSSGVTLQHPSEWTAEPSALGPLYVFVDRGADSGGFRRNINVFAQHIPPGTSDADYSRISVTQIQAASGTIEESSDTRLSGFGAHEIIWHVGKSGLNLRFLSVWSVRGRTAYIVTYSSDSGNFQSALAEVRRLITTIRLPPSA